MEKSCSSMPGEDCVPHSCPGHACICSGALIEPGTSDTGPAGCHVPVAWAGPVAGAETPCADLAKEGVAPCPTSGEPRGCSTLPLLI